MNSIPPELGNAIKIVQAYAKNYATTSGEDPNKVFSSLINNELLTPLNWNGSSICPYYKEYYALMVKKYIDRAEAEGKNILVESRPLKISRNTLVQQFYQGALYLVERLDPDGKYQHLRVRLEFKRHKEGIIVFWKYKVPSKIEDITYEGIAIDIDAGPKIKDELVEFLENGPNETRFERTNLALSAEHQQWIKDICSGVKDIHPLVINSNRIIIAKSSYVTAAMKEKEG